MGLVGAPAGFAKTLGRLPAGAKLRNGAVRQSDLVLWFARTRREVERGVRPLGARIGAAPLWILWPKKASAVKSDLTQPVVRRTAMARGLVDYKICPVDDTWSGLLFRRKQRDIGPAALTWRMGRTSIAKPPQNNMSSQPCVLLREQNRPRGTGCCDSRCAGRSESTSRRVASKDGTF